MSLDLHLRNIQKNAKSLRTLYFKPPGIFTNAIINKPEITRLIRDSDPLERSLYTIEDGEPHRIDGVNNYAETPSDEKTIIKIPDYSTQETPSTVIQLNDETEVSELLEKASDLVTRYPLEDMAAKLEAYTLKYEQLQQSIAEYELLEQQQAEDLQVHDINEDQLEEIAKEEARIRELKQVLEQND
ncbi:BA75_05182T0 [Komagataella pastoris]|uniref:DASH complex subunit SPC34 n=1 Tax=Komagataella pastoris TaxID=4922 RepID=A0A1B2JII0_PICPA|nr:BA75_05182T0 [Komagataella pastoris]